MSKKYIFLDLETLNFMNEPELLSKLIEDGWVIKALSHHEEKLDNFTRVHNMDDDSRIYCDYYEKGTLLLLLSALVGTVFAHDNLREVVILSFNMNTKKIAKLMAKLGYNCKSPLNSSSILNYSTENKSKLLREELRHLADNNYIVAS